MPFEDRAWSPQNTYTDVDTLLAQECACEIVEGEATLEQTAAAELAVTEASSVLFILGGRMIPGLYTDQIYAQPIGDYCTCPQTFHDLPACPQAVIALNHPVESISSVEINDIVVDSSEYVVYDYQYLVRLSTTDEKRHWPAKPRVDGVGDKIVVTYNWGLSAPLFAEEACLELACHFFRTALGQRSTLKGVTNVSLGGASWAKRQALANRVQDAVAELPAVERFLGLVNPNLAPAEAYFWSPDIPVAGPRIT